MPSTISSSLPFSPAELSYIHESLANKPPIRQDSRAATDFRSLNAETGILPTTNGSAHVSFSDGSEAIVGVKLEVEKSPEGVASGTQTGPPDQNAMDTDQPRQTQPKSSTPRISLSLSLPSQRDDDPSLVYLEEMLREPLLSTSLADRLVINNRFHWHIYIDVLLISPHGLSSYPLPLLSMATQMALRDTRVPRLRSEGDEDPIADDDWMASVYLYPKGSKERPPITLLVVPVGENVLFDPTHEELKVADAIVAVSIVPAEAGDSFRILSLRMINTPARDTMKGVPKSGTENEGKGTQSAESVWTPKLGGIRQSMLKNVVKTTLLEGVARDVMDALDVFVKREAMTGG